MSRRHNVRDAEGVLDYLGGTVGVIVLTDCSTRLVMLRVLLADDGVVCRPHPLQPRAAPLAPLHFEPIIDPPGSIGRADVDVRTEAVRQAFLLKMVGGPRRG